MVPLTGFCWRPLCRNRYCPGVCRPDADYFSHASGESFVTLPTFDGQPPAFANRPLLSPSDIRQPVCQHPTLGSPTTLSRTCSI